MTTTDSVLKQLLVTGNALNRRFDYDPIYRLLSATGRECDRPPQDQPWEDQPRGTDLTRARAYTETYQYDSVGSLLHLAHRNDDGGFSRAFSIESGSNRLQQMQIGDTSYAYRCDASGNMRSETTSRHFEWNHADQMKIFRTQSEGTEPSVYAHYLYDPAGQRVKKLVRNQGGQIESGHYIDAVFEHHRWGSGGNAGENNQVHVMDDNQRVAIARIGIAHPEDKGPPVQFHLGDHLRSSNLVVDTSGTFINREEFTSYGETSFGSFARKRYRYTSMERDGENGLSYQGARYYAPWLGRWSTADPGGMIDGPNLYSYVDGHPVVQNDPTGMGGDEVTGPSFSEFDDFMEALSNSELKVSLDDNRPALTPAANPRCYTEARRYGNEQATDFREATGMNEGRRVQAGHTAAARHVPDSQISNQDWDTQPMMQLHSKKGEGLDVTVTDQHGNVATRTRHTGQEALIDDAVARVRAANGGKLTSQGQLDAAAEVDWRLDNVPWDQRDVVNTLTSGPPRAGTGQALLEGLRIGSAATTSRAMIQATRDSIVSGSVKPLAAE